MNRKVSGRAMSMPAGIAAGCTVSLMMTILGAVLLGWLISQERLAFRSIGYGAMVILLLSAAVGAVIAKTLVKHRAFVVCLISGICYYLSLLGITALFFGGQYQGMGVTLGVVMAAAATVGMISVNRKNSITNGYRKLRTG